MEFAMRRNDSPRFKNPPEADEQPPGIPVLYSSAFSIYQRYLSAFISVQHLSAFNAIPQTVQVLLTFTIFQMRYPSVNMPSTNGWRSKDAFTEFVFGNLLK